MRFILFLSAIALMLSGCADEQPTASSEAQTSSTAVTTISSSETVTTASSATEPAKPQTVSIEAEVTDYRDGKLCFTYEGKSYELETDRETLNNKNWELQYLSPCEPTMAERIIHNKFGRKVTGKLRVTEDMSALVKCDIYTPNGYVYHGNIPDAPDGLTPDPDYYYSFKRLGGSKAQLINKTETIDIDLNDLDMLRKIQYPDECPYAMFRMFKFRDGGYILHSVSEAYVRDKFIMSEYDTDIRAHHICYFGTVQKNENDTAEILLNDGKALISVPSYYNDGEVTVGAEVMAVLDIKKETFYGTGRRESFDNALIYTDQIRFNKSGHRFEELSYAKVISLLEESFEYFTK